MEGYYVEKTWSVFESHSRNTFCKRNVCEEGGISIVWKQCYNPWCNALKRAADFNSETIIVSVKILYLEKQGNDDKKQQHLDLLALGTNNVSIKNRKPSGLGLKKVFLMINTAMISR